MPRGVDLATLGDYYYRGPREVPYPTLEACVASGAPLSSCTLVNDLAPGVRVYEAIDLAQTLRRSYDHFGDPDFWDGHLYFQSRRVAMTIRSSRCSTPI